jgi:circadian clock protein KaiC
MIVAQYGLVGSMESPIDLSYLADTVVLMRYFESGGSIHQAVSVLKKRAGLHERTIREFQITSGGIRLGGPLVDFQGVLTGVPIFKGSEESLMNKSE